MHQMNRSMSCILHWCLLFVWCQLAIMSDGYLNVFISHKEVMKLMGLEADLFYVHEGAINTYAMHFTVPVPADVQHLEFSWQSLTAYPLPYTITIDYEYEQKVLLTPTLSINDKGFVPQQIEIFSVHLPCSGNITGQVALIVNMLVQGPPRYNDTKLHFKRNKICIKGFITEANQSTAPAHAPPQSSALLGATACAFGLVLLASVIASTVYMKARKQIRQDSLHTSFTTAAYGSHQNVFIRLDALGRPPSTHSDSYATIASINKFGPDVRKTCNIFEKFRNTTSASPYATALLPITTDHLTETIYAKPETVCPTRISYYAASSPITTIQTHIMPSVNSSDRSPLNGDCNAKENLYRLAHITANALQIQQLIKDGTYGRIFSGLLKATNCDILIKTVIDGASLTQVACLLENAAMLMGIVHENILAPILANMELPRTPQIIYPYPSNGNLKMYLKKSREMNAPLSTRQLVEYGLHITQGLAHLNSMGIVHKDVATRNCYLDKALVKLCDNALSRDLFPDDYHCLCDNENRPLKWMALESLQQKNYYNAQTDIWSLGVVFWELATLASMPFQEVDIFELTPYLNDGYRLSQPINCPDEFFTVMSCCWLVEPKQRPSFSQLLAYLQDFHEDLGMYI